MSLYLEIPEINPLFPSKPLQMKGGRSLILTGTKKLNLLLFGRNCQIMGWMTRSFKCM